MEGLLNHSSTPSPPSAPSSTNNKPSTLHHDGLAAENLRLKAQLKVEARETQRLRVRLEAALAQLGQVYNSSLSMSPPALEYSPSHDTLMEVESESEYESDLDDVEEAGTRSTTAEPIFSFDQTAFTSLVDDVKLGPTQLAEPISLKDAALVKAEPVEDVSPTLERTVDEVRVSRVEEVNSAEETLVEETSESRRVVMMEPNRLVARKVVPQRLSSPLPQLFHSFLSQLLPHF